MLSSLFFTLCAFTLAVLPTVSAHQAFWHKSMYGFNVTDQTFGWDNRPVVPLMQAKFKDWWFHGFLDYPPHPGDSFDLPVGETVTGEIACDKGATSWYASSPGGNIQQGNWPCPGQGPEQSLHTTGVEDVKGCALAIAPKPDAKDVKPEDFAVFSVNHTCVWNRYTDFQVPKDMPACPEGGCTCAWFWIHSPDSGSEQMFMTGFHCDVKNARADAPQISKPQLARRCGQDVDLNGKVVSQGNPSNCTKGAKQPLYWNQAEGNNMFEGIYSPPYYNDLYDFKDGAQDDIFEGSSSNSGSSSETSSTSSSSAKVSATPTSSEQESSKSTTSAQSLAKSDSSGQTSPNSSTSGQASSNSSTSDPACKRRLSDRSSSLRPRAETRDAILGEISPESGAYGQTSKRALSSRNYALHSRAQKRRGRF